MIVILIAFAVLTVIPLIFLWFFLGIQLERKQKAVLGEVEGVSFAGLRTVQRRYADIPGTVTEEFATQYGYKRLLLPVILLTVLYALGFVHGAAYLGHRFSLWSSHPFSDVYVSSLLPALLAFMGAYLFNLGYSVRRIYVADLNYKVFWSSINQTLLAVGLAILLALVVEISNGELADNWLIVFFCIGFLANKYLVWVLNKGITRLGGQNLGGMPLTRVSGINFWLESRLQEEGIENVQNLATSDVIALAIRTQFDVRTLIDWVDQAIMLDRLDEKAPVIQDKCLICGAIDLAWASPDNNQSDETTARAIAEAIQVDTHCVALLMNNLFEDAQVQVLWTLWQTKFDKR